MIHLRPSRNILRQFTPMTGRRYIHTPNAFRRSAQPSSLLRTLPPSLPQRHLGIVSRCLSQTATVRDKAVTPQLTESQEGAQSPDAVDRWANTPAYDLTFTCKECSDRSTHRVSKQGYHKGTVLITCPGCKSRHLISDHLKVIIVIGMLHAPSHLLTPSRFSQTRP